MGIIPNFKHWDVDLDGEVWILCYTQNLGFGLNMDLRTQLYIWNFGYQDLVLPLEMELYVWIFVPEPRLVQDMELSTWKYGFGFVHGALNANFLFGALDLWLQY